MAKAVLEVKMRKVRGKACAALRRQGLIPAIVYGRGMESLAIEVPAKIFLKTISGKSGSNVIIDLLIADDGRQKNLAVITHGLERDALTDEIVHVDFHRLIMTEKIKAKVPIEARGEAAGIKEGGVLVYGFHEIEVECLPADIPQKIEVEVSALGINDSIHVSDLKVPSGVVITAAAEEMVITVSPPTKEEEVAPPAAEAAVPVEGEAAAPAEAAKEAPKKEEAPPREKAPPKEKS